MDFIEERGLCVVLCLRRRYAAIFLPGDSILPPIDRRNQTLSADLMNTIYITPYAARARDGQRCYKHFPYRNSYFVSLSQRDCTSAEAEYCMHISPDSGFPSFERANNTPPNKLSYSPSPTLPTSPCTHDALSRKRLPTPFHNLEKKNRHCAATHHPPSASAKYTSY